MTLSSLQISQSDSFPETAEGVYHWPGAHLGLNLSALGDVAALWSRIRTRGHE